MPLSCKECGDILTEDNCRYTGMVKGSTGEKYMDNMCKPCKGKHAKVLATLHKIHKTPPPGSPCEGCGRIAKLYLDHCHVTLKFRGFICQSCNHGIGQLGDSEQGVQKALEYLKRVNARNKSSEVEEAQQRARKSRSGPTLESFAKKRDQCDESTSSGSTAE